MILFFQVYELVKTDPCLNVLCNRNYIVSNYHLFFKNNACVRYFH